MLRKQKKQARQDRARKRRAAEENHEDSRGSKRRAGKSEPGAILADYTVTLSAEELFKLKHAGEFDEVDSEWSDEHIEIKDEPTENNTLQSETRTLIAAPAGSVAAVVRQARSPAASSSAQDVLKKETAQVTDRDNILDTLLSQDFNKKMTRHAVRQVLRDARDAAGYGNEFGVAHVEARIDRLRQTGIPPSRLKEVVLLFRRGLQKLLRPLQSRIDSIGGDLALTSPTIFPTETAEHTPDRDKHAQLQIGPSASRPQRGTSRSKATHHPIANSPRAQLAAFEAAHHQSDTSDSGDTDNDESSNRESRQRTSRYMANDDDDYKEVRSQPDNENDGDRSELTDDERSMLGYPLDVLLPLCLLMFSTYSEHL